jgi:hypothetical protein
MARIFSPKGELSETATVDDVWPGFIDVTAAGCASATVFSEDEAGASPVAAGRFVRK